MSQKLQNDEVKKGLLALAPFFLVSTSLLVGFKIGLIIASLLVFLVSAIFLLRNLIPSQQRLAFIIVLSVSCVLIVRMFLDAEAYLLTDKIGLFLPLLIINSLLLSVCESVFSIPDVKSLMTSVFKLGLAILLFLIVFGLLRDCLNEISFFSSSSGCLFLSGFLFSGINFFNQKRLKY